jgi:cytochrome c5
MRQLPSIVLLHLMMLTAVVVAGQSADKQSRKPAHPSSKETHTVQDRGERVFQQNCSRCHNAPEGFSQSISGTIATHMRVRANLSDADYKALLRFLNP